MTEDDITDLDRSKLHIQEAAHYLEKADFEITGCIGHKTVENRALEISDDIEKIIAKTEKLLNWIDRITRN